MKLVVNGEELDIEAVTLATALAALELKDATVATALNGEFVPKRAREVDSASRWRPNRDRRAEAGRLRPLAGREAAAYMI